MISKRLSARTRNGLMPRYGKRGRKLMSEHQLGIKPIKSYGYLSELKEGFSRYIVSEVVKETSAALLLIIRESHHWFPKSLIKFGYHPSGVSFAVDIPNNIAREKKLR